MPKDNIQEKREKQREEFMQGAHKVGKLSKRDVLHSYYNKNLERLVELEIYIRLHETKYDPKDRVGERQVGNMPNGQPMMRELTAQEAVEANRPLYQKQHLLVGMLEEMIKELDEK